MKIISRILIIILIIIIFSININSMAVEQEIDYTESLENFDNPERGFYKHFGYNFKVSENKAPSENALKGNLIHLRLGIGAFSKAVNGNSDMEFSEDMLNTFNKILKIIKSNGGTAIVRFAYDNFNGNKNLEPSLDMILKHITQLEPIFKENKDVISYIELGFFGPWGEMHSSEICKTENVSKAIDTMLEITPENIKIGVRQPLYYTAWAGVDRAKLNEDVTIKGTKQYRVGLFNDGYLGSKSDLGTFKNREIEIQWLEKQALHTLYGGEVVANIDKEAINTTEYISKEAFRTHTTYLNSAWNGNVINAWKEEIYNGEDKLYNGQTGYLYIANHLGYRFVLRNSDLQDVVEQNKKANIQLSIENVGFANLVNDKKVSIVLEKDDKKYEISTDLDATTWNSKEITKMNFEISLPNEIELGEYKVYLRISLYGDMNKDSNYQCIRLANNNMWNGEIGANYIGKINVIEEKIDDQESDDNENNINDNVVNDTDNNEVNNNFIVNNDENNTQNKDNTIAKGPLPNTGKNFFLITLILETSIFAIYFGKKINKK